MAAAVLGLGAHQVTSAHDFWMQPDSFWTQPSDIISLTLQVGDPSSQQRSEIPLRRVTRFESISPQGTRLNVRGELRRGADHDGELRFEAPGTHVLILETDNRAQSHLPADRFNAYVEEEGLTPALEHRRKTGRMSAEASERYSRRAKALVHVGPPGMAAGMSVIEPSGLSLEIVPEVNPYAEPRPERLPLRVLYDGTPLAGALVKLIDLHKKLSLEDAQRTDASGRVSFRMPAEGAWLVSVTWTRPLPDADDVDFETTFSTLSFGFPLRPIEQSDAARPMTAADLSTLQRIGATAISPSGQWLAWHQTEASLALDTTSSSLWLRDLNDPRGEPRQVSLHAGLDVRDPSFSGDGGWIYFLGKQSGNTQLWRVPVIGGSAEQVTRYTFDLTGFALSPKGEVAIQADTSTSCAELPCKPPAAVSSCCGSARIFDRPLVRDEDRWRVGEAHAQIYVPHWNAWMSPEIQSRIYVLPLGTETARSVQGHVLGDVLANSLAWAPDGRTLFFSLREAPNSESTASSVNVFASALDEAEPTKLTLSSRAARLAISPDGKWLAYVAEPRSDRTTLYLRNLKTGVDQPLAPHWHAAIESLVWEMNGKSLLAVAKQGFDQPLFRVSLRDGRVTRLTQQGRASQALATSKGDAVVVLDTLASPPDLYRVASKGQLSRLTSVNAARLSDMDSPEIARFTIENGHFARGVVVTPPNARGKLPTLLLIAAERSGDSWSFHWNPILFSAPGYAVVSLEPDQSRQSRGVPGPEHLDALLAAFSAAAGQFPAVDPANACVIGQGVFGGSLVLSLAGKRPHAFKCLVSHAGVFDARAMAYETDDVARFESYYASSYFEQPKLYEGSNPVHGVSGWVTPLLLLHGEQDYRVPYTQSLAAFTAAQRRHVASRLVVFPEESHQLAKPKNFIQWQGEALNWARRWLTP